MFLYLSIATILSAYFSKSSQQRWRTRLQLVRYDVELPSYPSPNPNLTLTSPFGKKMLGYKGGVGGQFHRICYWTVMSNDFTYTLKIATLWRSSCSAKRCEKIFFIIIFYCTVTDCMKICQLICFLFLCNVQKLHNKLNKPLQMFY